MKRQAPLIERWSDGATTPAEVRAAASLAALRAEPDLDPVAMARIQHRISMAVRPSRRRFAWRWQPAAVSLLVLGVASIAAATISVVVTRRAPVMIAPLSISPPEKTRRPRHRGPVIVGTKEEAPVGPPAPPVIEPPPAPKPVPLPAAKSGDGLEVRMFSEVTRAWRRGDARGALDRIDAYEDLFPEGNFAPEVILIKVDALQALGRSDEALNSLRYRSLARLPRSTELELIRGELSAKAGRCDEAVVDFDQVLRHEPNERLGERALYARASCRARLGDQDGAETDLRLYLLRHPNGPHVAAVRRALTLQ
jgi:hypothetical protein